jgi:hypothetical protein
VKIAIYGDSFGANPIGVKNGYSPYPHVGLSWWEMLASKYTITNFCEWSGSLLFSTNQFLKTHEQFDKIIFLVTQPGRITVKDNEKNRHFINYEYSTFWKKDARKQGWSSLLDSVLSYYKYINNNEYSSLQHVSYLTYLQSLRSDIFLIPCFENSFKNNFCLCDIFNKEQEFWNVGYNVEKLDIRKGHLTNPNHEVLFDVFDKMIQTNTLSINIDMFKNPDLPKEKYIL